MNWLNFHHLLYFYTVAREGSISRAQAKLRLSQPTISAQIKTFEAAIGHQLFSRVGRTLELTEMGQITFRYAQDIFGLGEELKGVLEGQTSTTHRRFVVGISDVIPKMLAAQLLTPLWQMPEQFTVSCYEDKPANLLRDLSEHLLDLVISDGPVPLGSKMKAFNHYFGESSVTFFARKDVVKKLKGPFPKCLNGAPMLVPAAGTHIRRELDFWFDRRHLHPNIVGEFDDGALLETLGSQGIGVFPGASLLQKDIVRKFGVLPLGQVREVKERYYGISIEKRLKHPAVIAIVKQAKDEGHT